jgi:hypothetical protein
MDEQQQLKKYIDENLAKGFIFLSTSRAAAPIFFVGYQVKSRVPAWTIKV